MLLRRCAAVLLVLAPAAAAAQGPRSLPRDAPLTLRPARGSRALARAVARTLAVRMDVPVAVGDAPPPEVLEAVPAGHCAIVREGRDVHLVLAGPEGQVFRTDVALGRTRRRAAARAVALAIEALRDAAIEGPPPGTEPTRSIRLRGGRWVTWTYRGPPGGLLGPARPLEATAKPLVSVGFLGGLSTERLTAQLAPRMGLGLCQDSWCALLEGDLPLVPEESEACDGRRVRYRPVTLSLRVLLRPLTAGDLSLAFGLGVLSRFGLANLVGVDASRLTTNFGLRGSLEGAWRLAGPLELVLELGLDAHTSPAILTRFPRPPPGAPSGCPTGAPESLLVEDIITVWSVLALRLRP